jgi:adenosine deaminase
MMLTGSSGQSTTGPMVPLAPALGAPVCAVTRSTIAAMTAVPARDGHAPAPAPMRPSRNPLDPPIARNDAPSGAGVTALNPAIPVARVRYPRDVPQQLSRKVPLAELHCHLGAAVTPSIMWSISHAQGIKLPTRDYWEFRDLITVHPRRPKSFDGYLQLFHWTELIQSSPIAVERAVYEVIGGAYRKNNVTTMELRFNPMKRNRGGEQDLDHIIAAAARGMDRATLEYPVKPGLIFCLDRAFPYELNEIIAEKAIAWRDRGVIGIDIAGPESATFRVADYRRLFRKARQYGLGLTVHTGESGPVEEVARVIELLEPDRIGHGVKAAYDPRAMAMLRDRGIVLEICPTSNLNTGVVSGWDEFRWIFDQFRRNDVRFTISTDGPEMLKTYIRDEMATLGRLGILSLEEQQRVAATSLAASFIPNVSDIPLPRKSPAPREAVEREEA